MSNQTNQTSPIVAVSAVLDQILTTGQIAQQDAQWLLPAGMILETELTPEEEAKLIVTFYRLELGVLKVMY
jgi:hypothetical protein